MATSVQVGLETLLWVQMPTTAGSLVIPVAKEQVGAVIGSGGSVVKGLQETTGAQISIVEEEGNKPTVNVRLGFGHLRHFCMRQPADLMRDLDRRSLAARHSNCRAPRLGYSRSPAATSGYLQGLKIGQGQRKHSSVGRAFAL